MSTSVSDDEHRGGLCDAYNAAEQQEFASFVKPCPFIKIILRETDDILLFESNSKTVSKESEEAEAVKRDNEQYDFLTVGKGRHRRTTDAEAQTANLLYKSRAVNTDRIKKDTVGTFVSNYAIFDTYKDLARHTQSLESFDKSAKIEITTYTGAGAEDIDKVLGYRAFITLYFFF